MQVAVDIRHAAGAVLAELPREAPVAETTVFDAAAQGAEQAVARVIAANLAPSVPARGR
jgi:hypothetical protein